MEKPECKREGKGRGKKKRYMFRAHSEGGGAGRRGGGLAGLVRVSG
ncbi:hypothetical protein E2C01_099398 [Portunus trituberculatus]|uniref:Uncharacterized protein n=1 Tax=Portunus trituberculatus TaxID=210409 RepID=A0A5B7KAW1_PORTR|nr:hypothetical protein [Portunus trituberculatus]